MHSTRLGVLERVLVLLQREVPIGFGVPILAGAVAASMIAIGMTARSPAVAIGDAPSYINAAYHLLHHKILTDAPQSAASPPALTREPGYAVFLSILMWLDPIFNQFRPECLTGQAVCDVRQYRVVSWSNLFLLEMTGIAMFLVVWRLSGNVAAALIAAAYILFNYSLSKVWWDPMSDWLGVFLVSLVMLATIWAWPTQSTLRWAVLGFAFAALTLTKLVFFWFVVPVAALMTFYSCFSPRIRSVVVRTALTSFIIYGLCIGAWFCRNYTVSGQWRLTDARGGIALSTREVFDRMSPAQYAAAFVFWSKGPGTWLAKQVFSPQTVAPFDLEQPGGFYDEGQNGYNRRANAIIEEQGISWLEATKIVDREIIQRIASHPLGYVMSMIPVLWRGFRIDEFFFLGLPIFFWMMVRAVRKQHWMLLSLLSIGAFNELFYAMISLNIPRYQMTAMPSMALAVGIGAAIVLSKADSTVQRGEA